MSIHDRLIEEIGAADGEPVSSKVLADIVKQGSAEDGKAVARALAELVQERILERAGPGLYQLSRPTAMQTPARSSQGRPIKYNPDSKRPSVTHQVRELIEQGLSDADIHERLNLPAEMSLQYYIDEERRKKSRRTTKHKQRNGTARPQKRLSVAQESALRDRLHAGDSITALMRDFNLSRSAVKQRKAQVFADYNP